MRARVLVVLLAAASACGAARVAGPDDAAIATRLADARRAIGVDPRAAQPGLTRQRAEAVAAGRADWRAAVDEIECRLHAELDPPAAQRVAQEGVTAARAAGLAEGHPALLRLRVCLGAMQLQNGLEHGRSEFDAVLALAAGTAGAQPRALALLERGVDHSRAARFDEAQRDLLAACPALQPWAPDHELCLVHLAVHYRRIGDHVEALRLLTRLREDARQRGAVFDEGVYVLITARVRLLAGEPQRALQDYEAAHRFAQRAGDHAGTVLATAGAAHALRLAGRSDEALERLGPLMPLLRDTPDRLLWLSAALVQAQAMAAAGRPDAAAARLLEIEPEMRRWPDRTMRADFLLAKAGAMRQLGRWREAWLALDEWRSFELQAQAQRLSVQSARERLQYHRERDAQDMASLRALNDQGARLRQTQAATIGLALALLGLALLYAVYKLREGRRLQRLAATDELTGVANRRAALGFLDESLARAQRDGTPLALLMVDVDRFKQVNDTQGHAVGDELLRALARVLPTVLRAQDRFGRLGGEEFVAVLPEATGAQAVAVAQRMRQALAAAPLPVSRSALRCTVSIGVAQRREGDVARDLLSRADAALYRAKAAGRDRVVGPDAPAGEGAA